MKPSALTLRDLTFLGIRVEIDPDYNENSKEYDFDGAPMHWGLRHGPQKDDGLSWWVGMDFATKGSEEKPCPYLIEVKAVGLFTISEKVPEDKREKFVFESGSSLVYGAIREMVSMTTSRSAHGALMLPTASFVGEFESHQKKIQQQTERKSEES